MSLERDRLLEQAAEDWLHVAEQLARALSGRPDLMIVAIERREGYPLLIKTHSAADATFYTGHGLDARGAAQDLATMLEQLKAGA